MSRTHELSEVKPLSQIYQIPNALDAGICEAMIQRFESSPEQQETGRMGQGAEEERSIKSSTDIRISGRPEWQEADNALFKSLSEALGLFAQIHPFFAHNDIRDIGYNLQRTDPGEYYHWHSDSGPGEFSQRQLVAIWYLNDVPGPGGQTEFFQQRTKVKPEQGKLILFPPFWTHVHRGVELEAGRKYIATTWVCFK